MNTVIVEKDKNLGISLAKYLKSCGAINVVNVFNEITDFINFTRNNVVSLNLIILDLEIPNLNIDKFVSSITNECNIIALTAELNEFEDYINFPYFQRIFQKPVSFSALLNYICIQNHIEIVNNSKKFVLHTLSELGFNLNHSGTNYLAEGASLAVKNKVKKLSEIYTLLAYNHNTDPKIVGWSINNAINSVAKSQDEKKLQSFFKIYDNRKLTAKYIINYFLNYEQ